MWIGGLNALRKPFVHLHTQFNRDLPWCTNLVVIDADTKLGQFKQELRTNEVDYHLAQGIRS